MKYTLVQVSRSTVFLALALALLFISPSYAKAETSSSELQNAIAGLQETAAVINELQGLMQRLAVVDAKIKKGSSSASAATLSTNINDLMETLAILTRVLELQTKMEKIQTKYGLSKVPTTVSKSNSSKTINLENLSITDIQLAEVEMFEDYSSDQLLTVRVKNNQFGSYQLSGKKANYDVRVYEIEEDGREATSFRAKGEFLVPYANGYSEFKVYIENGHENIATYGSKRTYQAKVLIDSEKEITESDESDNTFWSGYWEKYFKG
jgi:hypothetical protein